jgi:hypothetical protein
VTTASRSGIAGPGAAQHHRATEAVADRRHPLRIDVRIRGERALGSIESRGHHFGILGGLGRELLRLGRMLGHHALAVHVERESDVAGLGETPRLVARVLVVPPPLVHHQDAGTGDLDRVVPRDESAQLGTILLVGELAGLHGRLGARRDRERPPPPSSIEVGT